MFILIHLAGTFNLYREKAFMNTYEGKKPVRDCFFSIASKRVRLESNQHEE